MNTPYEPVRVTEIADLTAWLRRLSDTSPSTIDPAELAAFHTAKTTLLARIHAQHTDHNPGHHAPLTPAKTSDKDTR